MRQHVKPYLIPLCTAFVLIFFMFIYTVGAAEEAKKPGKTDVVFVTKPGPTITVAASPSANPDCLEAARLAKEMSDAVNRYSELLGDVDPQMIEAQRAIYYENQGEITKVLTRIHKTQEGLVDPAADMIRLEPELEEAVQRCRR